MPEDTTTAEAPPPTPRVRPKGYHAAVEVAKHLRCRVFPLKEDKTPKTYGGSWKDVASDDPAQIKNAWKMAGNRGYIGIDCGGSEIVVIDVDDPTIADARLLRLLTENPTLQALSLYRGQPHHIYRGAYRGTTTAGIDVKGAGGYILFTGDIAEDREIAPLPTELAEYLGLAPVEEGPEPLGPATVMLDEWLDERDTGLDGADAFIRTQLDKFWERHEDGGEHRRQSMRATVYSMALESSAGFYPAREAYERLLADYRASRDSDPDPDKKMTPERVRDYNLAWVGVASQIAAGKHNAEIERMRAEKVVEILPAAIAFIEGSSETGGSGESLEEVTITTEPDLDSVADEARSERSELPSERSEPFSETTPGESSTSPTPSPTSPTSTKAKAIPLPVSPSGVPLPPEDAFRGPHGKFALAVAEHTESQPGAVLMSALAAWGAWCGNAVTVEIGDAEHGANLFVVLVGESSLSRKSGSIGAIRKVYGVDALTAGGAALPFPKGFGSHVGVLEHFMPSVEEDVSTGEKVEHWSDARALWAEDEFSSAMVGINRDGSRLGPLVREMWDGGPLENRTKGSSIIIPAERHHVSIVGGITKVELVAMIDRSQLHGGTGNRFLWSPLPVTPASQRRPFGDSTPRTVIEEYAERLGAGYRDVVRALAHGPRTRMLLRDHAGGAVWADFNLAESARLEALREGSLSRVIQSRGPVQVLRMALGFALAEGFVEILPEHVLAAISLWRWLAAGVEWVFEDVSGDPSYDRMLRLVERAGVVSVADLKGEFGNAKYVDLRDRAISEGRIAVTVDETKVGKRGGRPPQVIRWKA